MYYWSKLKHKMMRLSQTLKRRFGCRIYETVQDAIEDVRSGSTIAVGGYGPCGVPENLLKAIRDRGTYDLHIYSMSSGYQNYGLDLLLQAKQIKRLTTTYIDSSSLVYNQWLGGHIELEILPEGTLIDKIRAGGAGIPGFYTQTGVGTDFEEGGFPIKYQAGGKRVEIFSGPKERRDFNGVENLFEESVRTNFSFIKAWKADKQGNLVFRRTARNFNPEMAMCAMVTIAEVEEIVEEGELDPDEIHTPSVFVKRLIKGDKYEKPVEHLTEEDSILSIDDPDKNKIAKRALKEIQEGQNIHLGLGLPELVFRMIPDKSKVNIHTAPGALGVAGYAKKGEANPDLIDTSRSTISLKKGASVTSSCDSMNIFRGGHLDLLMIGAFEVSGKGDLANWTVHGQMSRGIGGTMDIVSSRKSRVVCLSPHTYMGKPKIVEELMMPTTGKAVVDTLITELGVFEFKREGGMTLTEIARGVTVESVIANTGCKFQVASDLKKMD